MKQDQLYHIRYYGNRYDPSEFKSKSWRGWWIWLLNEVRFRVELRVMRQVLTFQAQRLGNFVNLNAAVETFESDVREMRMHVATERVRPAMPHTGSVEGHLQELQKRPPENPRDFTARMMTNYASEPRQRRYAVGRRHRMIMEADTIQEISRGETRTVSTTAPTETHQETSPAFQFGHARPIHPEYGAPVFEPEEDAEDDVARERLSATRSRHYDVAHAASEHQRRVLREPERSAVYEWPVHPHQRADAGGEGGGPGEGVDQGEHHGAAAGPREADAAGTEARPERVESASGVDPSSRV
jgi:hypothetical protein